MQTKTDNSYFEDKVEMRLARLPDKPTVKVLDAYSGHGLIWQEVQSRTDKEIQVTRIEKKNDAPGFYIKGDNVKALLALDLHAFDIIDLDAYGVPYAQCKALFAQRPYPAPVTVFVTFIQSITGGLPRRMLEALGYPDSMVAKCPTLFARHGVDKFSLYLAQSGILTMHLRQTNDRRKNYLSFRLE